MKVMGVCMEWRRSVMTRREYRSTGLARRVGWLLGFERVARDGRRRRSSLGRRMTTKTTTRRKRARDEDDDGDAVKTKTKTTTKRSTTTKTKTTCPYLDTIDAHALGNFDFEKKCAVSLSPINVYACLTCGKYYAGRGRATHAYAHALESSHHLFMRLRDGKTWCLPDGYEVTGDEGGDASASLRRIREVLRPTYEEEYVKETLERRSTWRRALDGTEFLVGCVGLNRVSAAYESTSESSARDFGASAVLQALNRVPLLRRALLLHDDSSDSDSSLFGALSSLTKKIWNEKNFKGHSSPHEFARAARERAGKTGASLMNGDAAQFTRWLLNELIRDEKKKSATKHSVVESCFRGRIEILDADDDDAKKVAPFLTLTVDLPDAPLFQDVMEKKIIPQVSLEHKLLKKFDGVTVDPKTRKRYRLRELPPYLVVVVSRFAKNNFFVEKNPTIVTFPTRGLNLAAHIPVPAGDETSATYDLIANVAHDGTPENGSYRAHALHAPDNAWYEIQDLIVQEVLPQQVTLAETFIQIYERRREEARARSP